MPPANDAPFIAEMLSRHGAALELYAAQWTGALGTSAAEDCVQEALVELAGLAARPENAKAWLYRVVRNRALNMVRSAQRRAGHEQWAARLRSDNGSGGSEAEAIEIADALGTLDDEIREVIVLRVWGRLTWEETAAVTGGSSSTMQRRYAEGLAALREIWETPSCPTKTDRHTNSSTSRPG